MGRYSSFSGSIEMFNVLEEEDRDLARRLFLDVFRDNEFYTDGRWYGYSVREKVRDGQHDRLEGDGGYALDGKARMYRQTTEELDPDEWLTINHHQPVECVPEMLGHQRGTLP